MNSKIKRPQSKNVKSRLVAGAAITTLVVGFVGVHEGLRLNAYRDPVGIPTICFGETKGVRMGDVKTKPECENLLLSSLVEHETGMRNCLVKADAIPDKTYAAFLSFTYNVGVGAFCKSTLARFANDGNLASACYQLPRWNKAGGKELPGLTRRRKEEMELCLAGLKK